MSQSEHCMLIISLQLLSKSLHHVQCVFSVFSFRAMGIRKLGNSLSVLLTHYFIKYTCFVHASSNKEKVGVDDWLMEGNQVQFEIGGGRAYFHHRLAN